jgi:hypothetical protein
MFRRMHTQVSRLLSTRSKKRSAEGNHGEFTIIVRNASNETLLWEEDRHEAARIRLTEPNKGPRGRGFNQGEFREGEYLLGQLGRSICDETIC